MSSFEWPSDVAANGGVTSLNTLTGAITLAAGTNITLVPSGSTITINSTSSGSVAIGGTVTGGTTGSVLFIDGSGNLAQDNTNFFWDDGNIRLGLGTGAPNGRLHISDGVVPSSTVIASGTLNIAYLNLTKNGANQVNIASTTGSVIRFIRADTDLSAPTTLSSGDSIMQLLARTYDGTTNFTTGKIEFLVGASVTTGSVPTDIVFSTGTASLVEAFRIKSNGVLNSVLLSTAGILHNDSSGNFTSSLIINADVSASAAIAYSKLNLTTSIVNGDISASAAIAYSKLNLATSILNADISATAAISYSKLAALTSANILVGSAGNVATVTPVTGDVTISNTGVTAIGSGKVTNAMLAGSIDLTTKVTGALPIANGGTGQITKAAGFDALQPMTTGGDLIYGGSSGTGTRLANGSSGQFLKSAGGTAAPTWQSFTAPTIQKFTASPTGATNYTFVVTSANATIGATYTNNGQTFTVLTTIAASTTLFMSGTGTPAASGTLTKSGGTGDTTITFSAFSGAYISPAGVLYVEVELIGGGGGGGGGGTTGAGNGGAGGNTTFGTSLLVGNGGGGGGTNTSAGGVGGTASLGSGPIGIATSGAQGGGGESAGPGNGGYGAPTRFGGFGATGGGNLTPANPITNTGAGGAGGGGLAAVNTGAGGGAGGYVQAFISSPSATYAYAVGVAGSAGSAGTNGVAAATGSSGFIIVREYYS